MEEEIEVFIGSGNVFADLGLPNPEERQLKAHLSIEIEQAIKRRRLSLKCASERLDMEEQTLSDVLHGRLADFSIDQLIQYLNKLGRDVEFSISVRERQSGANGQSTRQLQKEETKQTAIMTQ